MKKMLAALILMLLPAAGLAGQYEGDYRLAYGELGLVLNVGLVVGGVATGADWVLPLETLPEDFFDEFQATVFDLIDGNPFLPPEEKGRLKAMVEEFLDAILANWNVLVASVLDDLPESALVDQAAWPIDTLLTVRLEGAEADWPGLVDRQTGEFGLLPLVAVLWEGMAPWGSTAALHAVLADGEFLPQKDAMSGRFLNLGEAALIGPHAIVIAGLGVAGAFAGERGPGGAAPVPAGALAAWLQDGRVLAGLRGQMLEKLGVELAAAPAPGPVFVR